MSGATNGNGRLQQITERTLLPLGLVAGLVGGGIFIGAKIERFAGLEKAVKRQDTRLWLVEDSMETWRREIEAIIGQKLSDPKPPTATGDHHGSRRRTGPTPQNHHLLTASGVGGGDRAQPGSG